VLEIGTGWFPFVPIMAYLAGAKKIITVDIHPWLRFDNTQKTINEIEPYLDKLAYNLDIDKNDIYRKYDLISDIQSEQNCLTTLLKPCKIYYYSHFDITQSDFQNDTIDIIFSSNVLEHIPPATLTNIHKKTKQLVKNTGYIVHRFNPDDHYKSFTKSTINFLKYTEREWKWLGGYGLSYHNRMRSYEHFKVMQLSGLNVVFWADAIDNIAIQQLKNNEIIPIPRFNKFSAEAICTYYSWIAARPGPIKREIQKPVVVKWINEIC
jgi:predicted nicotinamide N-methyase